MPFRFITFCLLAGFLSIPKAAAETASLGLILPLSGPSAYMGQSVVGVMKLANPGNYQPVFEDDRCEGKAALTAYLKLRERGIRVFYVGCSGSLLAVAPHAKRNGDLILTTLAASLKIRETGDEVIRLNPDALSVADKMLGMITAELRPVAILHEEQEYCDSLANRLAQLLGPALVEKISYRPDAASFASEILKIKQRRVKSLILIPLADGAARTILRQIAQHRLESALIGDVNLCDFPFKPSDFGLHGKCAAARFSGRDYEKFIADYTTLMGHPPAYPFYDAMALDLFERLEQIAATPLSVPLVKSRLLQGFKGKFSSYSFTPEGEAAGAGEYMNIVDY